MRSGQVSGQVPGLLEEGRGEAEDAERAGGAACAGLRRGGDQPTEVQRSLSRAGRSVGRQAGQAHCGPA